MLSVAVLAVAVFVAPVPEEPESIDLFSKEAWYRDQAGKEMEFVGVLTRFEQSGVGFGRFNPYRLILNGDKKEIREVYVGGKPDLLKAYVGKRVKLVGKAVDMEVEGRMHREIWPARLFPVEQPREAPKPRIVMVLGEQKLYKQEAATEKVMEGILRMEEKGGFVLEMKSGREPLTLYPDTHHLLTPFVGQSVRIIGKQVTGQVGMRKFQHTLPGSLEILEVNSPSAEQDVTTRLVEVLRKELEIEEQRRRNIEQQFNQPIPDVNVARQMKLQMVESMARTEELKKKLAELEQQLQKQGPEGTNSREELERALMREKQELADNLARFKDIQKALINLQNVPPAELIQTRQNEHKAKEAIEKGFQRVRDLEEKLARLNKQGADREDAKARLARQKAIVQDTQQAITEIQAKIRTLTGKVPLAEQAKLQLLLQENTRRLPVEEEKLKQIEAEYQQSIRDPNQQR